MRRCIVDYHIEYDLDPSWIQKKVCMQKMYKSENARVRRVDLNKNVSAIYNISSGKIDSNR